MTFAPSRIAIIPTGTLMKKIQCHERYWVSTPPMVGPIAVPSAAAVMTKPMAFPFCFMGMYAVIIAGAMAVIMAPPTAWNTREATSTGNELRRSGRYPQENDPIVKMTNPERKTFLKPIPSASLPKIKTQPAITSR